MKNIRVIIISVIVICIIIFILILFNRSTDEYFYGNSYRQNKLVNTIRLHKYGITGKGVKVGLIDAGFYKKHSVFNHTKIIKEFNFVSNKTNTEDYNHVTGMNHGTNVFSVLGGYQINELIGIAFGADFFLAKTDKNTSRLKQEEIYAVNASRWLFESGARIITTSASFNKFDDADYYYSSQMDGQTALITKTADSLVNEGVIYFASAGNNFENDWRIIEPPADGIGVIAAGSVDKNLNHSFFSSCGPTRDGRIKPDLSAPGEGVWSANYLPKLSPEFGWDHGTSLSAPIAAGIAALVLSAHPELTNKQVIEAIKNTASKHDNPDSLLGWGIPDAEKAVTYFGPAFSNIPEIQLSEDKIEISTFVFSFYGVNKSTVSLNVIKSNFQEDIYIMKQVDKNYFSCMLDKDLFDQSIEFYLTARDDLEQQTKFPNGFLGQYFHYNITNKKLEILSFNEQDGEK
jgi:subtilisin family serine protease